MRCTLVVLLLLSALATACSSAPATTIPATPASVLAPAGTSTPSPVPPSAAVDYPLKVGNSWTYLVGIYNGFNPSEIATSTYVMTETVTAISTDSSYYVATVRQDPSPEFAIYLPEDMAELPGGPPEPGQYWLIAEGNRLYREHLGLDLSAVHQKAALDFVFPLQVGAKWYESEEMAKAYPDFKNDSELHQVEKVDSVVVPAGKFENCYYLTEHIGGSAMEDWFCPGIGYVDQRNEHHGTPFGGRQVLISYHVEK